MVPKYRDIGSSRRRFEQLQQVRERIRGFLVLYILRFVYHHFIMHEQYYQFQTDNSLTIRPTQIRIFIFIVH